MTSYNATRALDALLEAHRASPPSFTVKLYPDYWLLNNGGKCLYNNQMASLLDDIRAQRIPVDFLELFDSAKLPFYDGCMIVELQDFRPQKASEAQLAEPQTSRVVLAPNPETLWADLCLLNQRAGHTLTARDALEIEARILVTTAPPLCLDPDPHLARIANHTARASIPTTPLSLKRKAAVMEQEDGEVEKTRRTKFAQYMNPKYARPAATAPSYRVLNALERWRIYQAQTAATSSATPQTVPTVAPGGLYPPGAANAPPTAVQHVLPVYPQPSAPATAAPSVPSQSSTPAPTVNGQTAQDIRRASASTTPAPHLQPPYVAQVAVPTPPRNAQSPHQPVPTASTPAPQPAQSRPPSAAQPQRPQSAQQAPTAQPQPQPQPPQAAAQPQPAFQQPNAAANYAAAQAAAATRKKGPQPSAQANGAAAPNVAQPAQAPHPTPQQTMAYYQFYAQQHMPYPNGAQRMNPALPAQATRSPMAAAQGSAPPQHTSPLAPTQRLPTRSPMPPSAAAAQGQGQPQQAFNYAALQSQLARPLPHGQVPHPQLVPHPVPNGAQAGGGAQAGQAQDGAHPVPQMMAQYAPQMYMNYPMQARGMQPNYWMGRGPPVAANGQRAMQGQLGANKVVQGGVQGS